MLSKSCPDVLNYVAVHVDSVQEMNPVQMSGLSAEPTDLSVDRVI